MITIQKIDHIGIAVTELVPAIRIYERILRKGPDHCEVNAEQNVRTAFFKVGEVNIELLEDMSINGPIAQFIGRNGHGGIHHISLSVDDIVAKLAELKASGFQLIHEQPVKGANGKLVAFVHPKSTGGVLLELSQESKG